jgi:hypothetical protein
MKIKLFSFLLAVILQLTSYSQITTELIYPVVPIADNCHLLLDDTASTRIISKANFLAIKRLWTTQDICYNEPVDTLYIKKFDISFTSLDGRTKSIYYIEDGLMESEYQSSLMLARENLKPFTKIELNDIQYEQDGAFYQIAPVTYYIDSIVVPKVDSCWTVLDVPSGFNNAISQERLIHLIRDSLGINTCTKEREWSNDSLKILMMMGSNYFPTNGKFPSSRQFYLSPDSNNHQAIEAIKLLDDGDVVQFSATLYEQGKIYYKTRFIHLQIADSTPCTLTTDVTNIDMARFTEIINRIRKSTTYKKICFTDSTGSPVRFKLIFASRKYPAQLKSIRKGYITKSAWLYIRDLKDGDRLVMEGIHKVSTNGEKKYYDPFIITLE